MRTLLCCVLLVAVCAPHAARADEINPESCEEEFGQGGVTVSSSEGTQNATIDANASKKQDIQLISIDEALLFFGLGFQARVEEIADQLGLDGDQVLEKFSEASIPTQSAGFKAILLDSEVEGLGFLGALAVAAFTDPVYAFEFTYANNSGVEQTVDYQMPLNTDPTPFVNDTTFARSYLEIDLVDANGDGDASLGFAPGSAGGFMATNVEIDNFDAAILIDDQGDGFFDLGEEITEPTAETQVFDTGVASLRTFASDPEFVTGIGPSLRFMISPGDEVRFRGVITVAETLGLLADPLLALNVVDNGFIGVPEPSTAVLALLGLAVVSRRVPLLARPQCEAGTGPPLQSR